MKPSRFLSRSLACLAFLSGLAEAAQPGPNLGASADPARIAAWSMNVFPDGRGLPPGKGGVKTGEAIYQARCAACHGVKGTGGSAEELAGAKHGLTGPDPDKTIGTYWPYATTLFDFIRRSMPPDAPGMLDDNAVYAVTAYLLHLNGLVAEDAELSAQTLPWIKTPNREGFVRVDAR